MSTQRMSFHIGIVAIAAFVAFAGCVAPQAPRASTDGAFEGTISRVWEDGLSLDVDGGGTILIDTWSVCGDGTARNLSPGDSVRVYATRDLVSYDAWRILNVEGQPACGTGVAAVAQESGDDEGDTRARRSADEGAFEGTVSRVWEDGLTLDVNGGGTITVDTWSVCGDNTARDINRGDALRVYASRDFGGYDAWQIVNEASEPACSRR